MKIIIVGGGWYGAHTAYKFQNDHEIILLEKKSEIFAGSSSYNQNRLHLGYHYPRSYETRFLCKNSFAKFMKDYQSLVQDIDSNYYLISTNSIIDYTTYVSIFENENYVFQKIKNDRFDNINGDIISVPEKMICHTAAKQFFQQNLTKTQIKLNYDVKTIEERGSKIWINGELEADLLIDCTYGQLERPVAPSDLFYEKTVSFVYKKKGSSNRTECVTIMDGQAPSLFLRDKEQQLYSLTHVKHTPIFVSTDLAAVLAFVPTEEELKTARSNMEADYERYDPSFRKNFTYESYYLGFKTKKSAKTDDRTCLIDHTGLRLSVNGGKITGIYDFEEYLRPILQQRNAGLDRTYLFTLKRFPTDSEVQTHTDLIGDAFNQSLSDQLKKLPDYAQSRLTTNENKNVLVRYVPLRLNNRLSFNPIIGMDKVTKRLLTHTNSYMTDNEFRQYFGKGYDAQYQIYPNIYENYKYIYTHVPDRTFTMPMVYFGNSFTDSNIGHCTSVFFGHIDQMMRANQMHLKICIPENTYPNARKLLEVFFPPHQIVTLETNKVYEFAELTIYPQTIMGIERFPHIVSKINEYCTNRFADRPDMIGRKIIMVKQSTETINSRYYICNISPAVRQYCADHKFDIVLPENYDIYELIFMLNNASVIITSGGAISYNHMIYFNKKAKNYFVGNPMYYAGQISPTYIREITVDLLKDFN